jgi:hypothetical protein
LGPTSVAAEPDAYWLATMKNLGNEDLTTPDKRSLNYVTFSGASVTNRTDQSVTVSTPTVVGLSQAGSELVKAFNGQLALAPGETTAWTAFGSGTFARADLTGWRLQQDAAAWWSGFAPDGRCNAYQPTVTFG